MIEFISEEVRTEFHLLPLERQKEIIDTAARMAHKGYITKVLFVERLSTTVSEVAIRFDQQFDKAR